MYINHVLGKLFKEIHKSQHAFLSFRSLVSKTEAIAHHSMS